MSIYAVKSDTSAHVQRTNNIDAFMVQANSTAEAKALCSGASADLTDATLDANTTVKTQAVWSGATVEAIASSVTALFGWVFNIIVSGSVANVTVTGDSDDTLDDIAAKLVIALNATAINAASYNSSTNVLTIAAIADGIGDKDVTVTVTPPLGLFPADYTWAQADVVGAIVDLGMAAAALTVTFSTSWVAPGTIHGYKQ